MKSITNIELDVLNRDFFCYQCVPLWYLDNKVAYPKYKIMMTSKEVFRNRKWTKDRK